MPAKNQINPKYCKVILNGQISHYPSWPGIVKFNDANLQKPAFFGKKAIDNGEAPFKAVFSFKDGNIVGLRGDKYAHPTYIYMLQTLHNLAKQYFTQKLVHEIKIYDNRGLLPGSNKIILHWHENKNVLINLLPVYSGIFDIKI